MIDMASVCLKELSQEYIRCDNIRTRFSEKCPRKCELREPCRVLAGPSPEYHFKIRNAVHFDQTEFLVRDLSNQASSMESTPSEASMLEMMRFFAHIDVKTLALLLLIVRGKYVSVHRLAAHFRVSDGTITREILLAIRRKPELRHFFEKTLSRVRLTHENPFRRVTSRERTPFLPGFEQI